MKKYLLFSLLSFASLIPCIGQMKDKDLDISVPIKLGISYDVIGVVGHDDDGYYVLRVKTEGFFSKMAIGGNVATYLDYYNRDMVLENTKKIKDIKLQIFSKCPKKCFEFFTQDKHKNLYLFHSERIDGTINFYRSKLNKDSFKFVNTELISKHRDEKNNNWQGSFELLESEDKSQKAIISYSRSLDKDQTNIHVSYLDQNLNETTNQRAVIEFSKEEICDPFYGQPYILEKKTITKRRLSNNGDLVLLAKTEKNKKLFDGLSYEYQLVSIAKNKVEPKYLKLDFKGRIPLSAGLSSPVGENDKLRCTGFYGHRIGYGAKGIFNFNFYPSNLNIEDQNMMSFSGGEGIDSKAQEKNSNEKLNHSNSSNETKYEKDKTTGFLNYYIKEQIEFADGSFTIAAEYFSSNYHQSLGVTYITHGDLLFIHINPQGEIEWIVKEKKSLGHRGKLQPPYSFRNGEKIFFIYSDDKKNQLTLSTLNKSGEVQSKSLAILNRKDELGNLLINPQSFRKVDEKEIIGFAFKGRVKGKMIRLKL